MKRAIISAILLTLMIGLFVIPQIGSNTTQADQIPQEDIDPLVETYLPSAEGDPSGEDITEFHETLADDVRYSPDSYNVVISAYAGKDEEGDTLTVYSGAVSDVQVDDSDYMWVYGYMAASGSYIHINWTFMGDCSYTPKLNAVKTKFTPLASASAPPDPQQSTQYIDFAESYIYNWSSDAFVLCANDTAANPITFDYSVRGDNQTDFQSSNGTVIAYTRIKAKYHLDNVNYVSCKMFYGVIEREGGYEGYSESFSDVSDWTFGASSGLAGGHYGHGTDGDVWEIWITPDSSDNEYVYYYADVDIPVMGSTYYEYYGKAETGTILSFRIRFTDASDVWILNIAQGDTWTTRKASLSAYAGKTIDKIDCFNDDYTTQASGNISVWLDYLRIGPSDEMGWQHDGSTLEGVVAAGDSTISTDGESVRITKGAGASWTHFYVDSTATKAKYDPDYYPFVEVKFSSACVGNYTSIKAYNGTTSFNLFPDAEITQTTYRFNVRALTDTDIDRIFFYALAAGGGIVEVDYVQAYSIANYTYEAIGTPTTSDYLYVDSSGHLHGVVASASNSIILNDDPALSVNTATYNVANMTIQSGASNLGFKFYVGSWSLWNSGTTRKELASGTLTEHRIWVQGNCELSAIKFWEDFTDPTISTFTNTPLDPNTASTVTIETISSDVCGVYTAEATAVVEPSGSSIGTVSMALDYTTQGGAEIWSYEFSADDLLEGRYTFELEVDDGANQVYEYLTFTVGIDTYDCHIVILNNLYELIPFDTFEVYKNDTRIYHDIIRVTDGNTYNITVKNRFGDTVNSTIFDADYEMVVFVDTYSFKFMNYYNGFLRINVTRASVTYSEIIMPLEIVEFNLFQETYTFTVDFLNGTTKYSQEIAITNSTGYVITGDSLTDVFNLVNTVYDMTTSINVTVVTTNNNVITISIDLENVNSTIWDQTINILTNIENSNSTIYDQTITLISQLSNINSTLYAQTVTILSDLSNMNTTLYDQTVTLLSNIENVNSTLYAQTVTLLSDISNVNTTIYTQTVSILSSITNVNSTIYSQTVDILNYVWNNATSIYNQTVTILSDVSNMNSTLYDQTVTLLSNIENVNSTIYSQTVDILADISNMNSTIYAQTVQMLVDLENVNSTLYDQTVTLIANIANIDSDIAAQTVTILADIENVNSTLYTQTVTLLSDISNVNTTLYTQTVTILSDISNVNSTLYSQTVSILSNITNVNSTIYTQTVSILNYVWNNANSIYNQTLDVLSDVQNTNTTIYTQTVSILSQITNVNSTIYSQTVDILNYVWNNATSIYNQTLTILSNLSNVNTTLYAQTVTLLSNIENVNSTIYSQTVSILSNISNMNSTIYAQTVTLLSDISNVNSTLYAQTVTLLSDISNVNSTLYLQTVTLLSNIENVNSTIYTQTVSILSQITNMNSTIYSQTVTILSNLAELNATIYLVDDPTNLNPLVLGYSLSDDYCDFTIVSTWHNASVSIYDNDVLMVGPTSELLSPIRYALSGSAGTHNLSVFVDGGADSFWYNISYSVALDIRIEEWSVEDYIVEITGLANADINWYIYNEGIYSGEWGSESESIGFHFTFAKNIAIGKHNFSVYFNDTIDGAMYRWFNNSYTISAIYGISNIYIYNQGGDYVDWEQFTFLVNGSQIFGNQFYNRTDHVFLISIEDVFGEELYSATHSWARTTKITLDVYSFLVANMLDDQFIYFNLTRVGGGTWSKHIVPTGFIEFELLYAATYNYEYSTIATDGTVRASSGSVTVSADTAVIIFSLGLTKILSEVRLISPGGGVGKEYVEKQFAIVNATLGVMWGFLWFIGGFLILALWIVPFVSRRRRRDSGSYSPSSRPSSGSSKPKPPGSEGVFDSSAKLARKQQKKLGIRQDDERQFGPRE